MNENLKRLLVEMHEINYTVAEGTARAIKIEKDSDIIWEEFQLIEEEEEAFVLLSKNPFFSSIIQKLLMEHGLAVLHDFFAVADGVSDPYVLENEEEVWLGMSLVPKKEDDDDEEFIHDEIYSTYWDWKESKSKKGDL